MNQIYIIILRNENILVDLTFYVFLTISDVSRTSSASSDDVFTEKIAPVAGDRKFHFS